MVIDSKETNKVRKDFNIVIKAFAVLEAYCDLRPEYPL